MFGTGFTTDTTGPGAPRVVKDTILRAVPSGFFSYTRARARLPPVNISIAKIAKKASPPKPEFPLFPIAQIPSVARLRIGRCPDRIVRVDKLELRYGIVSARRMGDPGKGQLF